MTDSYAYSLRWILISAPLKILYSWKGKECTCVGCRMPIFLDFYMFTPYFSFYLGTTDSQNSQLSSLLCIKNLHYNILYSLFCTILPSISTNSVHAGRTKCYKSDLSWVSEGIFKLIPTTFLLFDSFLPKKILQFNLTRCGHHFFNHVYSV